MPDSRTPQTCHVAPGWPMSRRRASAAVLATSAAVCAPSAWAQFRVDIAGVGLRQIPVALPTFRGQSAAPQAMAEIMAADLQRSGQFQRVDAAGVEMDENTAPDLAQWRSRQADALVGGSIVRLDDGRFDVRFRLWDVVQGRDLGGQGLVVAAADLRLVAHRMADFVYERLTGERGIFSTRLSYVSKSAGRYTLWVADADGHNAQSALSSAEPIISPAWSPKGGMLAYVSFESRKPVVYTHEVATGRRRLLANFRGSNSAPAWSHDAKTLAVTLTRDGASQLYTISAEGGQPKRLMEGRAIDTEPAFTPDGHSIYFVSDRGGSPQIYKVAASGGAAERVTFEGSYNISPSISPDGKWLAYISRVGGDFRLHVMDLQTGAVRAVTDTSHDESPSFAPNSRLIVYATRVGGQHALMTTTLDGKIKARLAVQGGEIREPHWGPFAY